MSRKYPYQIGAHNAEVNRAKQRFAHTADYYYAHRERELREAGQGKIEAFKQSDPDGYERMQQRKAERDAVTAARPSNASATESSSGASEAAGVGAAGAAGAVELIGGLTLTQLAIGVIVIAAVAYGGYRFYKWYKNAPASAPA